uniref:CST complex subunit STN1 n=1 Tax=Angiostrongylus cantonensis TaxID=6313 RepID=A0A0K0D0B8_ANGCA
MNLQLLKRPQPLPHFNDEENGIHAQWRIKAFYYRKDGFPQCSLMGQACVKYASLLVTGKFPRNKKRILLVNVGYVESKDGVLDIRGCDFRLLLFGVEDVMVIRDSLRFLIIRQRVPHSLLGKPFEWQVSHFF